MIQYIWKVTLIVGAMIYTANAEVVQFKSSHYDFASKWEFAFSTDERYRFSVLKGNITCSYSYDIDKEGRLGFPAQTINCVYDTNNRLAVKIQIIDDTLFGKTIRQTNYAYYYPNGNLFYQSSFVEDEQRRICTRKIVYYENGKLESDEMYEIVAKSSITLSNTTYKNAVFILPVYEKSYFKDGTHAETTYQLVWDKLYSSSSSATTKFFNQDGSLRNIKKTHDSFIKLFIYESKSGETHND